MTYVKYVDKVKNFLLELFFPAFCFGCKKEGTYLCQDCKATLEISEYCYCLCNKNPLRLPVGSKNGKCGRCANETLSGLYSALPYKERSLTRQLIHNFKYEPHIKDLAKVLAEILMEHFLISGILEQKIWEHSVLVPVPMEKKKQKSRGYNQAEELAKELSKKLNIPLALNAIIKTRATLSQMKLTAKERQENLKDAFSIENTKEIKGKKIFLVDDVYTTGSTMQVCAKVLKSAGAKQVWGIVVAREG